MELDVDCLLEARVENVERLALALGVRLPPNPGAGRGRDRVYARKLVRAVLKRIEDQRTADYRARWRN